MKLVYVLPLIVIVALLGLLAQSLMQPKVANKYPIRVKSLPQVELQLHQSTENASLHSYEGQWLAVNIFASWCASCVVEHHVLMDLTQRDDLQLVGLNWKDKPENLNLWLERYGNPYDHILYDPKGQAVIALGVTGAPETYLVNPQGEIVFRFAGPLTSEVITDEMLPLIDEG